IEIEGLADITGGEASFASLAANVGEHSSLVVNLVNSAVYSYVLSALVAGNLAGNDFRLGNHDGSVCQRALVQLAVNDNVILRYAVIDLAVGDLDGAQTA